MSTPGAGPVVPAVGRFGKKPVVVEAVQFDGTEASVERVCDWLFANGAYPVAPSLTAGVDERTGIRVNTNHGRVMVMPGDWVIRGVDGEFYPCRPDVFDATYEPARQAA